MKRFAPLALIVLALAAVPAAFADDGTTPAPATSTAAGAQQPGADGTDARARVGNLRKRMRIVSLRFRLHCGPNGKAQQEKCTAFAQKVSDRLTTLDGNVQKKLDDLKACTTDSTDAKCKNADKKIAVLTRVDTRLQNLIAKVQDWLSGKSIDSSSSSDSALDQAASALAGSN